jgi:hypothetical protein
MEDNKKLIEQLLNRVAEYGKTSFELAKLKALDKTSDIVSSFVPHSIVFVFIVSFLVFLNIGLSFWIGELLGKVFYGFFVIAAFYGVIGLIIHFFLHNRIKKVFRNFFIKQLLK